MNKNEIIIFISHNDIKMEHQQWEKVILSKKVS
jgi:hypothetical protein